MSPVSATATNKPGEPSPGPYSSLIPYLILACIAGWIAVSNQSLWIDECYTASKAACPTFHAWLHAFLADRSSNLQQPLHTFYVWGWARIFGLSERSLRASNLPWFFFGFYAISRSLRRRVELRNAVLLIYCLHPFVWYYVDEARPYMMQISGALAVTGALFDAFDDEAQLLSPSWWWLYGTGLLLLCGSALLGTAWAISVTLALCRHPDFLRSIWRAGRLAVLLFGPLLILLALYYLWTFHEHIRARYQPMTAAGTVFIFYEQLGFAGLGPGRVDLRPSAGQSSGIGALALLRPFLLPILALAVPLAWGLWLAAKERLWVSRGWLIAFLLVGGIPLAFGCAMGWGTHVRVLGRHVAAFFPIVLLVEAWAFLILWKSRHLLSRAAAILMVAALTVSSLELRFAIRHFRDDYRSAVGAARQALQQGETVWWSADVDAAVYYKLPVSDHEQHGAALHVMEVPPTYAAAPNLIILSKPDLFDPSGALAQFVSSHHYRLAATYPAFTVWHL